MAKIVTLVSSVFEFCAACSLNELTQNSLARIKADIPPTNKSLVKRVIVKSAKRIRILSAMGSRMAPKEDSTLKLLASFPSKKSLKEAATKNKRPNKIASKKKTKANINGPAKILKTVKNKTNFFIILVP